MKYICFLFLVLLSFKGHTQTVSTPIFGTMWYLTKIEENGITYPVPEFNGFGEWRFHILQGATGGLSTEDVLFGEYCVTFTGSVKVEDNSFKFIDNQFAITLNMCSGLTNEELIVLNKHIEFYQNNVQDLFEFQINNVEEESDLIITNALGDKAFYSTIPTGTASVEKQYLEKNIKVYPNPSTDKIFISFPESVDVKPIKIFTLDMKEIGIYKDKTIDVSAFSTGMYIISIEANGYKMFRKIIVNH